MTENNQTNVQQNEDIPVETVNVVAEMTSDSKMRDNLEEVKANDGYPDSCGSINPNIAPGMNTNDPLEEAATEKEKERGEYTEVTKIYLDRTPDE